MNKFSSTGSVLFFMLSVLTMKAQVVKGIVVDGENMPISDVIVVMNQTTNGQLTDYSGKFQFVIEKGNKLEFRYIGCTSHRIFNLPTGKDTIDLGEIKLIETPIVCFGARRHSKLKSYIQKKDLHVRCSNGNIKYTWIVKEDNTFELDYKKVTPCIK